MGVTDVTYQAMICTGKTNMEELSINDLEQVQKAKWKKNSHQDMKQIELQQKHVIVKVTNINWRVRRGGGGQKIRRLMKEENK